MSAASGQLQGHCIGIAKRFESPSARRHRTAILAAALLLASACEAQPLRTEPDRFLNWTVEDPVRLIEGIGDRELLLGAGGLAVLVPLVFVDEPVHERLQERHAGQVGRGLRLANEMGALGGVGLSLAVFGVALSTDDLRFQNTAWTSLQAAGYAGATALLLKLIAGRARPDGGTNALRFRPLRSFDDAWPSGHTAVAFALATPWVKAYRSPPSWMLLAVAGSTGLARLALGRHWLTDVYAGAAIGAVFGVALADLHRLPEPRPTPGP